MGDWFQQQALSGSLVLAIPVALVAGLVSFFSPCVIPLLPGYLSYATGLSGRGPRARPSWPDAGRSRAVRARLLRRSTSHRLDGRVGRHLADRVAHPARDRARRSMLVLLGLAFAGLVPFLQRDVRVHIGARGRARRGAVAGLPVRARLDAVRRADPERDHHPRAQRGHGQTAARCWPGSTASGSACRSSWRRWPTGAPSARFRVIRRHQQWVTRIGGLMLVLVGLALVTGWWDQAVTWLQFHLVDQSSAAV